MKEGTGREEQVESIKRKALTGEEQGEGIRRKAFKARNKQRALKESL